jgi:hypothetical protein
MAGTPIVLHPGISGLPLSANDYNDNLYLVENSFFDTGAYVISGATLSVGSGLGVNVAAGLVVIGAEITVQPFTITGLLPNLTNALYLLQDASSLAQDVALPPPARSVCLGTAATAATTVNSVNMGLSSGRQQFVTPQSLVPGGPAAGPPSAGHLGSINLANWAAAAAEGIAVYGTLPAGAAAKGALLTLCAGFIPAGTGADVAELVVPYDSKDGTTSIVWNVRRIDFRVQTAGGAPSVTVEKSTVATAFVATAVGTVTLASGAYEGSVTASLGTVASGNKIRMNVITLATATNWTVEVLLGA